MKSQRYSNNNKKAKGPPPLAKKVYAKLAVDDFESDESVKVN